MCKVANITDLGYILSFLIESLNLVYYDLAKQLSHYFIFLFGLTTRKEYGKVSHNRSQVSVMSHDECGKVVHRPCSRCISSIQKLNKNSIEFFLSTQTRSVVKSSQAKSLHGDKLSLIALVMKVVAVALTMTNIIVMRQSLERKLFLVHFSTW